MDGRGVVPGGGGKVSASGGVSPDGGIGTRAGAEVGEVGIDGEGRGAGPVAGETEGLEDAACGLANGFLDGAAGLRARSAVAARALEPGRLHEIFAMSRDDTCHPRVLCSA